jgi:cell division protein FtsN
MANLERHAYEADDAHAFDGDKDEDSTEETSRLPLLIVIALVVLSSFAGVVWLAYTQGVERGREDAPRLAAVAQVQSPKPSVASPPYAGLKIYQQPASATADSTNAEKAAAPPPVAASPGASAPPPLRPASATTEKPPVKRSPPMGVTAAPSGSRLSVVTPAPPPQPPAVPDASSGASAASVPDKTVTPVASHAGRGGIFLQIGSYKSDAEALQSWSSFRTRHAIASAYRPDVKAADLGAKGTWYRLRLGPFADKQSAASFCEKLRTGGANCLLAK